MRKTIIAFVTCLSLVFGGLTLQGCINQNPEEVSVQVPNVNEFAQTAQALSAVARVTYLHENAAAVKAVLDQVVGVVEGADHDISGLILATVDEAIAAGKIDAAYKLFFLGTMGVVDSYFQFRDFNVDDVVIILKAASNGLDDGVTTQSVGFNW